MHPFFMGLLIGLGLAAFLFVFEIMSANASAATRAKKYALKKAEWNQDERARVQSMARFCAVLPIGIALIWWLIQRWL